MINFLKKIFGFDAGYEQRYQEALNKFATSENPYDIRLAFIFAKNRSNTLSWDDIDAWMKSEGFDKDKLRDSVNRFELELK